MPVYKDKQRGTWFVKFSQTVDGKRRQILKRGFAKKTDAQKWEAEQRTLLPTTPGATFREMTVKYMAIKQMKPSSEKVYWDAIEQHFPHVDLPIGKVTKAMMVDWLANLNRSELSQNTKARIVTVVRAVFNFAEQYYDMPNPAKNLTCRKKKSKVPTVWSPEEFERFLSVVDIDLYRILFCFLYYTGCRKSEALTLQREDITGDTVHFHRAIKTEASERTLKLAPQLLDILRPLLDHADGLLFPIPLSTLTVQYYAYLDKADVPRIRIHDFRHSFATNAIGSGANIVAVSKYLGHASVRQTLDTYTHLFKNSDDELVNLVNGIIPVSQLQKSE